MQLPHRHHIEMGVTLGAIACLLVLAPLGTQAGIWPSAMAVLCGLLMAIQPAALFALIDRFRPVGDGTRWTVVGSSGAGLLANLFWPFPRPTALIVVTAAWFCIVQGVAAWNLVDEARRREGVSRLRLVLGGAGTSLTAVLVLIEAVGWWFGARPPLPVQVVLAAGVLAGYWLGFAPPRRLRHWRQQAELTRFLRQTAERAADERTDHLGDDVHGAVMRGVAALSTAVMLGRDDLTICATSEPNWEELQLSPAMGLIGIATSGTDPVVGPREECERPLNELAGGDLIAVLPITHGPHRWGAVLLVERRESAFQQDDLAFVTTLCRHAAEVLDYARLVRDERAPRPRLAGLGVSV